MKRKAVRAEAKLLIVAAAGLAGGWLVSAVGVTPELARAARYFGGFLLGGVLYLLVVVGPRRRQGEST